MTLALQALILGIIQGLTEFLPVSSSAHLILVPRFLGWQDLGLAFDVALHLGTLAGVVLYFWKDLLALHRDRKMIAYLIIGTVPAALAGFLLEHHVETVFRSPQLVAWTLMGAGLALGIADWRRSGRKTLADLDFRTAALVGLAQSLALVPGVSRSGITITAALAMGFARTDAARFSFLLSIPVIAGAGLLKSKEIFAAPDKAALALGFTGAAASGLLAIWLLLKYVQTRRYTPFVIYRWILGAFILIKF